MKIKALIACVGLGYNLKTEEVAEVKQAVGEKLVKFGYAEEIKEESQEDSQTDQQPDQDPQEQPLDNTPQLTVDDLPHKSGWYELPNGEKVQGKEKAEEALAEFYKEKSDE